MAEAALVRDSLSTLGEVLREFALNQGLNIVLAGVVLWGGLRVVQGLKKVLLRVLSRQHIDPSLESFLQSVIGIVLYVFLFLGVAGILGVEMTSFITLLGAAGLAIGISLQGALSNFAGGVMLLVFRPFTLGDTIEAQGYTGKVRVISIVSTILTTADNRRVILPNGPLASNPIVNFTAEGKRRLDVTFSIGYNDDLRQAKEILKEIIRGHELVLEVPAWRISVGALGPSSVDLLCKIWVRADKYVKLKHDLYEQVKYRFDAEGISIPYPHREIIVRNEGGKGGLGGV